FASRQELVSEISLIIITTVTAYTFYSKTRCLNCHDMIMAQVSKRTAAILDSPITVILGKTLAHSWHLFSLPI
ncbi:MAG: hypothetical protein WC132_03575, partial [Methanomethylophilus sp.]